jgi:hypothetical protein
MPNSRRVEKVHDVLRQPQIGRSSRMEWARTAGGFARLGVTEGDTIEAGCGPATCRGRGKMGRVQCCATVMGELKGSRGRGRGVRVDGGEG